MKNSPIYTTGLTSEGTPLVGGIWRLFHQDGFPLEMSYIISKQDGFFIDWVEAMADASIDNNLPALYDHIKQFLPAKTLTSIMVGFQHLVCERGLSYQQILEDKRKNAEAYATSRPFNEETN